VFQLRTPEPRQPLDLRQLPEEAVMRTDRRCKACNHTFAEHQRPIREDGVIVAHHTSAGYCKCTAFVEKGSKAKAASEPTLRERLGHKAVDEATTSLHQAYQAMLAADKALHLDKASAGWTPEQTLLENLAAAGTALCDLADRLKAALHPALYGPGGD
jgi:hypothetical protein